MQVNIYITTENTGWKSTSKGYGFVLECLLNGEIRTVSGFGTHVGTYHNTVLVAINAALKKMRKPSEIHIFTPDTYIADMYEYHLDTWAENDFKSATGAPVANQEQWKEFKNLIEEHLVFFEKGQHSYNEWLKNEIKRRKAT